MADFARIEADADEPVAVGERLFERLEGLFLAQVAQEAQDQFGVDSQLRAGFQAGAMQPV
jgi:hypothetical protein